jgi:hypothetical protein
MNSSRANQFFRWLTAASFTLGAYNAYKNAQGRNIQQEQMQFRIQQESNQEILEKLDTNSTLIKEGLELLKTHSDRGLNTQEKERLFDTLSKIDNWFSDNYIGEDLLKFIHDFSVDFNSFLSTLSIEQQLIVVNILGCLSIGFTLIIMINLLFGNTLIKYFKLEERFPFLKRWIEFRFKFTNYSLAFNFLLIFLILGVMLFLNIYILM